MIYNFPFLEFSFSSALIALLCFVNEFGHQICFKYIKFILTTYTNPHTAYIDELLYK